MKLEDVTSARIEPINREDTSTIFKMVANTFSAHASVELVRQELTQNVDLDISKKLVLGDKIIGAYLLGERDLFHFLQTNSAYCKVLLPPEDVKWLRGKRGVQGVALVVLPEYKGRGYGKQLIDLPSQLGYDYIWGEQLKSLGNLHHWLKRRQLVADCSGVHVTMQKL